MTTEEMKAIFESSWRHGAFNSIMNPMHNRPDICAFLMLDKLLPSPERDLISCATHDEIWLDIDLDKLAEVATEQEILNLARCGVRMCSDGLAMFV